MQDLDQGFPVDVSTRRDSVVVVSVADRRVMLTHPRVGQQQPYEAQVLEVFCAQTNCVELTVLELEPAEEQLYHGQVRPEWRFAEGGASCHHGGARLNFTPAVGLPRLRRLCRGFFQELEDLQRELAWQQALDAPIEWEALAIRPTPGRTRHYLVLNESGDTVLADLPLLHANASLLPQITPWLRQRLSAEPGPELQLDGNSLRSIAR